MMNTPPQSNRNRTRESKYGPSYGTPTTADASSWTVEPRTGTNSRPCALSTPPPSHMDNLQPLNMNMRYSTTGSEYGAPRYGELPPMRRRRKGGDSLAKWTTRAVLASPLLVLVLWSLAIAVHSTSTPSSSPQQQQVLTTASTPKQMIFSKNSNTGKNIKNKHNHNFIVRPKPPKRGAVLESSGEVISVSRGAVLETTGQVVPTSQQNALQKPLDRSKNVVPVIGTLGSTEQTVLIVQPSNLQGEATPETESSEPTEETQESTTMVEENPNELTATEDTGNKLKLEATEIEMNANQPAASQPIQSVRTEKASTTKIYYYDASASLKDGNLHIPDVVYDANGQPIKLADLNNGKTKIYLEPPVLEAETQTRRTAAKPVLKQQQQETPQQQLSFVDSTEPPEQQQDQMIIISTVAVMALLVGALSARRLRSRNFLSSCIENESLEDELAYDTAYTTNQNTAYDTFGASPAPWRGDLEKFDV